VARRDPYVSYRFLVEIDKDVVASFSECSGLQAETEVEEFQEGGENRVRHKLPKSTKWGALTLKRGLTDSKVLWDWFSDRMKADFQKGGRKSLAVILWNETERDQVWRWDFADAFPTKWTGPELKGDANAVAVETLEFAHSGLASSESKTQGGLPGSFL
jgi:phage tail-like protein